MSNTTPKRILLIGGGSGIGHAIAAAALERGDQPVIGARDPQHTASTLPEALRDVPIVHADLADEYTLVDLQQRGPFDAVVSLAAASANGPIDALDRTAIHNAFDAKVAGPLLLAKHLHGSMRPGGVFVFFSGVAAWKPAPGLSVMATVNGAVAFMAEALAVELAPVRAVAISPGIIDSGLWDFMGDDGKRDFFEATAAANPARRVGTPADIVGAVLLAVDNTFITGTTLHVDGGGHLG
ncbi:short-chain dehydrogenase [Subtercola sp. Z020]|uniref:SDR family oxidoreductase n=1 Tax=Subtercola sp. Z020 TaxID=2080582 RepID=UPI000CE81FA4|nr:SDR family oxidoreductase [Subtercola sp. Z020]PPF77524.1 short-chain dehydrogenase [Subtercola sp. Z020]